MCYNKIEMEKSISKKFSFNKILFYYQVQWSYNSYAATNTKLMVPEWARDLSILKKLSYKF